MEPERAIKKIMNEIEQKGAMTVWMESYLPHYLSMIYGVGYDAGRHSTTGCKSVLQYDMEGNYINEFPSALQASKETPANHSGIIKVCKGVKNSSGGYKWKYKT